MTLSEATLVLTERRNWLTARIKAKESVGWDVEWDVRERDALTTTLDHDGCCGGRTKRLKHAGLPRTDEVKEFER